MVRIFRFLKSLLRYIIYGNRVPFEQYVQRLNRCVECEDLNKDNWTCEICGCYVDKKLKMSTETCPKNKRE